MMPTGMKLRHVLLGLLAAALLIALSGCSGTAGSTTKSPTPGGTTSTPSSTTQFLFAAQANAPFGSPQSGALAEYQIDTTTGTLTLINGALVASDFAAQLFRDPNQHFLYVEGPLPSSGFNFNVIAEYTVSSSTGALDQAPGSPFDFNQQELAFMAIRPDLRFAYVNDFLDPTLLHVLSMNPADGALLQEVATVTIPSETGANVISNMSFDPSGRFLFIGNSEANTIAAFASDPSTGALTPVPGSPFTPRTAFSGVCSPKAFFCGADFAVTTNFLYYVSTFFNSVAAFEIDPTTGALTELANSPVALPPGEGFHIAATPEARFLYVESPSEDVITGYAIDSASGALTQISSSPTSAGPQLLVMDRTGQFLYDWGSALDGFKVNGITGALSPVPGSPFPLAGATGLAIVH
jgi:6-phosphogluconolactonase